jgi:hypothetical protein
MVEAIEKRSGVLHCIGLHPIAYAKVRYNYDKICDTKLFRGHAWQRHNVLPSKILALANLTTAILCKISPSHRSMMGSQSTLTEHAAEKMQDRSSNNRGHKSQDER